jgi:hypothetical protein
MMKNPPDVSVLEAIGPALREANDKAISLDKYVRRKYSSPMAAAIACVMQAKHVAGSLDPDPKTAQMLVAYFVASVQPVDPGKLS